MSNIITGGANLAQWVSGEFRRTDVERVYDMGLPQIKFVVMEDGQINGVEQSRNSKMLHKEIYEALGMGLTSLLLAGKGTFLDSETLGIEIKSSNSDILDRMISNFQARPSIVDDFQHCLEPHFPGGVTISNTLTRYL
jgi:hypothetical protein